jgi:hypothetical protein
MKLQFKSKQRVTEYGEVLTPKPNVDAMLGLVRQETERIDSRFLEPACGTENSLIEVLERKLKVVEKRYKENQFEYERYAVLAVSSLHGIDILKDNPEECRKRLYDAFNAAYTGFYRTRVKERRREAVRHILKCNIIRGDALSLQTIGENPQPIVFSEWSLVNGSLHKRRDFAFHELLQTAEESPLSLFDQKKRLRSDNSKTVEMIHIENPFDCADLDFRGVSHAA